MPSDCLFCKIAARELGSDNIVYETERTVAFIDIRPVAKGHTLVIPKTHARNIFDIDSADLAAVMETVRMIAPRIKNAVGADGVNIIMNNEPEAGQVIFHPHVHIIPRRKGDGFESWHGTSASDDTLKETARVITAALV